MEYILLQCEYNNELGSKGYIPFGRDPGGNNFCFDFSNPEKSPKIVFWNHEIDSIYEVAETFTDFIELLHE